MTDEVLPSYGMLQSTYFLPLLSPETPIAIGYEYSSGSYDAHAPHDINGLASGNLYTSATDLTSFMMNVLAADTDRNGIPLEYDRLSETFEPQFVWNTDPERNGLGWITSEALMGELMVWHQGGDYEGCSVVIEKNALRMTGVGYLKEIESDTFAVLGGPYAGETVIRNRITGSLHHQGIEYQLR